MTFHLYGFIIGCSIVLGSVVAQNVARQGRITDKEFEKLQLVTLVSGLLGARLWHVFTDFTYYEGNLVSILAVWRGGLSIIGAGVGAALGLFVYNFFSRQEKKNITGFLDAVVYGLPLAQALGRLGNYWNQELYGSPTTLPWKIFIDSTHRLPSYEQIAYYHPLFAYEALALGIFSTLLWWQFKRKSKWICIGTGVPLLLYIFYYSGVRFLLDFLRIDTAYKISGLLGINQTICIIIFSISSYFLFKKIQKIL